jgi:mono/diheme cytochrome c family protein
MCCSLELMKRYCVTLCLLPLLLTLPATGARAMPADGQSPLNRASVNIGRDIARAYCAGCHAIGRTGTSPDPRAPRFPLIAERYPNGNPAPDLVDGTVIRHPGMPEFRLIEIETDGLVAYLRRISRRWKPPRDH